MNNEYKNIKATNIKKIYNKVFNENTIKFNLTKAQIINAKPANTSAKPSISTELKVKYNKGLNGLTKNLSKVPFLTLDITWYGNTNSRAWDNPTTNMKVP